MWIWGVTDLVSKPDFNFPDGKRSIEFRCRRVIRFISKVYHTLLETRDTKNVYCLSLHAPHLYFPLLDGSLRSWYDVWYVCGGPYFIVAHQHDMSHARPFLRASQYHNPVDCYGPYPRVTRGSSLDFVIIISWWRGTQDGTDRGFRSRRLGLLSLQSWCCGRSSSRGGLPWRPSARFPFTPGRSSTCTTPTSIGTTIALVPGTPLMLNNPGEVPVVVDLPYTLEIAVLSPDDEPMVGLEDHLEDEDDLEED